jgi:DNA-binding beta-propeller fold protein YncE
MICKTSFHKLMRLVLLGVFLMPALTGCEGSDGSSGSAHVGSAGFTLKWPDESATDDNISGAIIVSDDCSARGVVNVSVYVRDLENHLSSGRFPCSAKKGTIENISVGTDRQFLVSCLNASGVEIYHGLKTGVTIKAGSNDVGTISVIRVDSFGTNGTGDGQFRNPTGLAIDFEGNVYVSDFDNDCIQKFTTDGTFIRKWSCTDPEGLVAYGERLFVCGLYDRIEVYDYDGVHMDTWRVPDTEASNTGVGVMDIDVDADGILYVLDTNDRAVKKFNWEGSFLGYFPINTQDQNVWAPLGIAIAGDRVYTTEGEHNRVHVWDLDGAYIRSWGTEGNDDGEFSTPVGIAIMGGTSVIVGDINGYPTFSRIQKFNMGGVYEATIQPDLGGFYPKALAVNNRLGKVYITSGSSDGVLIVDTF